MGGPLDVSDGGWALSGYFWARPKESCAATCSGAAICAAVGLGVGFAGGFVAMDHGRRLFMWSCR